MAALVPLLTANRVIEELDISSAIISKKNMQHLWLALHMNDSVTKLTYSKINFMAISEFVVIEGELTLNRYIKDDIKPRVPSKFELSLGGIQKSNMNNEAILKYIKTHPKLQSLDLSDTNLTKSDIKQFIDEISSREIRLKTLNLSGNPKVGDKVV